MEPQNTLSLEVHPTSQSGDPLDSTAVNEVLAPATESLPQTWFSGSFNIGEDAT